MATQKWRICTDEPADNRTDDQDIELRTSLLEVDTQPEEENYRPVLRYKIRDKPSPQLSILLAIQHFLTCFGSNVAIAFILSPALCIEKTTDSFIPPFNEAQLVKSKILSTIFFTGGICTIIQILIGSRLPIMQGGSFAFIAPVFALMSQPEFACSNIETKINNLTGTVTYIDHERESSFEQIWMRRICEVQGAIILAGLFEFTVGITGIIGFLMKYIGPLTIAPVVCLIGLSLMDPAFNMAGENWLVAFICIAAIIICSQYLNEYLFQIPFTNLKMPILGLFPVLIGILISWGFCLILTLAVSQSADNSAFWNSSRVDTRTAVIHQAPYFQIIYPFQFGFPTFSMAGFLAVMSGSIASMLESIGDYYSLAEICHLPPPPQHSINRGIAAEGFGCILAGIFGTGNGATSFSENIGAIAITKVASRHVMLIAGFVLILLSLSGKISSVFVTIPNPVVGGLFCVMFGMITGVGISNLKKCSFQSSRNLFIFGFSLFFGIALPRWVTTDHINTSYQTLDNILYTIMKTDPFVGGLISAVLDNTIPGSDFERGIIQTDGSDFDHDAYNVPILDWLKTKFPATSKLPFMPNDIQ